MSRYSRIKPDRNKGQHMEPEESLVRSTRLARVQHLLHKNAPGLTSRELAVLCGVNIRTIQRDLNCLQNELKIPLTQQGDRYGIMGGYLLPPVSFSLYEAMALFLASRLVLHQTDESNPHIEEAMRKIAAVLPEPLGEKLGKVIRSLSKKPANPDFMHIYEQVALAWSTQRRMKISYLSAKSNEEKEWLLEPYFVDMTGVGYSTYVIGRGMRKAIDEITTFKLERIKQAELLEETFVIPENIDLSQQIASSWGIMFGETTEVKLKFSPQVARRVKESIWHPSQTIEDLPDGSCLFAVKVGSVLEMTPWIRGWGPDVEVLEPESLRIEFISWAQQLNNIYQTSYKPGQRRIA